MSKVYSVIIKGRTLESRDLKELLARAVTEKRGSGGRLKLQTARPYGYTGAQESAGALMNSPSA